MSRRGEKVALSAGAERMVGVLFSAGAERGVRGFRWGGKVEGWDSRCIRGDQNDPSGELWTSGWTWTCTGGLD